MITPDAVANLIRLLRTTTAPLSVQPAEQLRPVLPELTPGERVSAYVLTEQPNGRFHVLIKDSLLDLNLPRNSQPGQTLELVVEKTGNRPSFSLPPAPVEAAAPDVEFSETVKLLKAALPPTPAGTPAKIVATQALSSNPAAVPQLAQALQQGLENSGLFYEAHQEQWVLGQRPLSALQQEPQAQWQPLVAKAEMVSSEAPLANIELESVPESLQALARLIRDLPLAAASSAPASPHPADEAAPPFASPAGVPDSPSLEEAQKKNSSKMELYSAASQAGLLLGVEPEKDHLPAPLAAAVLKSQDLTAELGKVLSRPEVQQLVQQQMQAMDPHIVWQGPVWPGQEMRWDIVGERAADDSPEAAPSAWSTRLSLQLPVLGQVDALLQLTQGRFMLRFAASEPATVFALRQSQLRLESQFSGAGLELGGATVEEGTGDG